MLKILKSRIINALNCGPERTQLGAEYYLQVIICQAGKLAANAVDTVVGWKTWPTLSNLGNYPSPASHLAPLSLSGGDLHANPLMPFIIEGARTSEMHAEYNASWLISGQNNIKLKQIEHKKHSRIRQTPPRGPGQGAGAGR